MHTHKPLLLGRSIQIDLLYFHSFPLSLLPHTLLLYVTDCTHQYRGLDQQQCYAIIPSVTALQAHKYKDTLFGSLPCLIFINLPSYVSLQTHTVLPVNKYSLSSRIINTVLVKSSSLKDETECIGAYIDTKHAELHCWKIFFLCFCHISSSFLASALRPKIWSGRGVGGVQAVICLRPQGLLQVQVRTTHTHTQAH